ncbi:GNAT family N-acetyltransferase [Aliihoeflea sp. 2WW]|uniref:GNAT family N-acetyltransferase n=1 Tax=Aliihoeflea sp. 2WW TaxID=1381123 RepID=UPI000464DE56|nr:GNAT family N-acetyltransferase [Aliihoeflea sp. 2WW]
MFVRTVSKRDLKAVQALLAETWHATYDSIYGEARVNEIIAEWHSMAALEAQLESPLSEFLVADDGTQIGGVVYATAIDEGKTVMLHQLYVRPDSQGRGIGGLLLDEIEGCFPDADKVRLEVEEANAKAVTFYLAQGFAKVGQTPSCGRPDSGIPADIYERPIMWAD